MGELLKRALMRSGTQQGLPFPDRKKYPNHALSRRTIIRAPQKEAPWPSNAWHATHRQVPEGYAVPGLQYQSGRAFPAGVSCSFTAAIEEFETLHTDDGVQLDFGQLLDFVLDKGNDAGLKRLQDCCIEATPAQWTAQKGRDKAVVAAAKKAKEDAAAAEAGGTRRAGVLAQRVLGLREEDFSWEDMRDGLKRGGAWCKHAKTVVATAFMFGEGRLTMATPDEAWRMMLAVWRMVPSSDRIIQDIDLDCAGEDY